MKIIYLELFEKIFIKENKKFLGKEFKNYDLLYFFPELNNGDWNGKIMFLITNKCDFRCKHCFVSWGEKW